MLVPSRINAGRDYSSVTAEELAALSDEMLAEVDPLAMNLVVANGIPTLAELDIRKYREKLDRWVLDFRGRCLPQWEPFFHESPADWEDDIQFFRFGALCQFLEQEIGIQYNRHQRDDQSVLYVDPSDVFLNGVLDTREGTCGNMAALHVAMGWRMGWPVSLACVASHYILRFDDGETVYNIEATQAGHGGFKSDPDEYVIEHKRLPEIAVTSGSDLRALRPREVLGVFVSLRARHFRDLAWTERRHDGVLASEADWLLARWLFPTSRAIYRTANGCHRHARRGALRRRRNWASQHAPVAASKRRASTW
ncbi:MAG: transglutaminase family protein [Pirellulaceae bacterium]